MSSKRKPNIWPILALIVGSSIWFLIIAIAVKK